MRKALLIGVGKYDLLPPASQLVAPPNDARAMCTMLATDDATIDGAGGGMQNFDCQVFTTPDTRVDTGFMNDKIDELLRRSDDVLLFFAGHGTVVEGDLHLMAQDCNRESPGISASDLLERANRSPAASVVMILDCCHAGQAGPGNELPKATKGAKPPIATLRENRTILAAARSDEQAWEEGAQGIFTGLLLAGLAGGAADPRGYVTASSLHGYAEFALGAWDQRPIYKSHASMSARLRRSRPRVSDRVLLRLAELFPDGQSHRLDPSYEFDDTNKPHYLARANPENVRKFILLKQLRNAGLIRNDTAPNGEAEQDLYFLALGSGSVHLTAVGQRYWYLVKNGKLRDL